MNTSNFLLQTQTLYGLGCSRNIGAILNEKGFRNVVIFVDEGVKNNSPYFDEVQQVISDSVIKLNVELLRGTEEPDYDYLDAVADKIRGLSEIDVLIGIGGGSCLDITKAVAVLMTNSGKGIDYRGFDKVKNAGIPTIAIPTTAGTGSEVTINAVFTDKQEKKKLGINGRYVNATYAILDAEWTMSCPTSVAVSSGMDALVHTLESFMCKQSNPLTRVFSREAFKNLYEGLPCLVEEPQNKEKRQRLLLGSYLAGIALFNSGSGIAGAMSYPLGVNFKIPHGIAGGILIASVVEYNVRKGYLDYAELFDLVDAERNLSVEQKNILFLEMIRNLSEKLNVPRYLDKWNVTRKNLDEVVKMMIPLQAAFDQNPIPFSVTTDAMELLKNHVV
jgi:alcohol dehydrogenase class IV